MHFYCEKNPKSSLLVGQVRTSLKITIMIDAVQFTPSCIYSITRKNQFSQAVERVWKYQTDKSGNLLR